jgi:AcrR family transcriptional regulator
MSKNKTVKKQVLPRKQAQQERSKAMVQDLLEATARVLVQVGYDKASTNRIAEAAGVSIGSLYQYFPTKEALVSALIESHIEHETNLMTDSLQKLSSEKPEKILKEFILFVMALWGKNKSLRRVFVEQVPQIGKSDRVRSFEDQIGQQLFMNLFLSAGKSLPKDFEISAFVMTKSIMGVIRAAVLQNPGYLDQKVLADELTDMILKHLF